MISAATDITRHAMTAEPTGDTTLGGRIAKVYEIPADCYLEGFADIARWSIGLGRRLFALDWTAYRGDAVEVQPIVFGEPEVEIDGVPYRVEVSGVDVDEQVVLYRVERVGGEA